MTVISCMRLNIYLTLELFKNLQMQVKDQNGKHLWVFQSSTAQLVSSEPFIVTLLKRKMSASGPGQLLPA